MGNETETQIQPLSPKEQHELFLFLLSQAKERRKQLVKQIEYSSARGWYDPSDDDEKNDLNEVEGEIDWLERNTYHASLPENFFKEVEGR